MTVTASDKDDALLPNGMIRYKIVSKVPTKPLDRVFTIDKTTGVISTIAAWLDRETTPQYVLVVQASDMEGDPDIGSQTQPPPSSPSPTSTIIPPRLRTKP
ncbi:cadherin-2-like isoform X2 [Lampetra planeri]